MRVCVGTLSPIYCASLLALPYLDLLSLTSEVIYFDDVELLSNQEFLVYLSGHTEPLQTRFV